eukprot:1161502-Pelagomonas_calceolata.AAC.3
MEQRRQELLSDKDGYWHQRMRMEEQVCVCPAHIALFNSSQAPICWNRVQMYGVFEGALMLPMKPKSRVLAMRDAAQRSQTVYLKHPKTFSAVTTPHAHPSSVTSLANPSRSPHMLLRQAAAQSSTINEAVEDAASGFENAAPPAAAHHHHHSSNRSSSSGGMKGGRKASQHHSEDANGGAYSSDGRRGRGREGRGNTAEANGGPPSGGRFHRECAVGCITGLSASLPIFSCARSLHLVEPWMCVVSLISMRVANTLCAEWMVQGLQSCL